MRKHRHHRIGIGLPKWLFTTVVGVDIDSSSQESSSMEANMRRRTSSHKGEVGAIISECDYRQTILSMQRIRVDNGTLIIDSMAGTPIIGSSIMDSICI
jgi:hypothetical protein